MKIIWANQALYDTFRLEENISGVNCYAAVYGRSDPCPGCTLSEALQIGAFKEGEMTTPDGRSWLIRSNPVIEDEKVSGAVHVAINITMLKNAEEALRRTNRQLNLLNGITRHDILNEIQVMIFLLNIIEDKIDISPIRKEYDALGTANRTIQSLIEFTKMYEGIGTQHPQWHNPNQILSGLLQPDQIAFIFPRIDQEIYADPLFGRVFSNLLDNSVRHGLRVTSIRISTRIETDMLIIIYEDNGIGIPSGKKEKIFERGFGRNTGLGLFFIREILSITGISIRETGRDGEGAIFEISVPPGLWREK